MHYFRARYYDPITGRWLSNDPIGISGGLNQYVFCANNPVNFADPLGLCEDDDDEFNDFKNTVFGVAGIISIGSFAVAGPDPSDLVIQPVDWGVAAIIVGGGYVAYEVKNLIMCVQGKGERGHAARPDGTPNPYKHTRPHPTKPDKILQKDPHTGKWIEKPKPWDYPK